MPESHTSKTSLELLCAAALALGVAACSTQAAGGGTSRSEATSTSATPTVAAASATSSSSASAAAAAPAAPTLPPVTLAESGPFEVVDLHVDTPWKVHFKGRPLSLPKGHATPALLERGHYAAIVYPIYIPDYINDNNPTIGDADAIYDTIDKLIAAHELLHAATDGPAPADKVAAFVAIEGAGAFAADITQIDRFVKRGVRFVGPVHARDNKLASAATGKRDRGLSDLGKDFCRRVYAAGGLVDVSHMSDKSFADLAVIASEVKAPIVATHSNARAKAKHKRNLTDEQLATIAQSGGIAGLNLHRTFVRRGKSRMKDVVTQVMYMVKVAGIDHVAIGSDYDGGRPVGALKDAGKMQELAQALLDAGLEDAGVRKIFGGNALRVLAWRPADAAD